MSSEATARPIYLDYQATTPTDARVVEAMLPFLKEKFGNPHSVHHFYGREAEEAVETARAQVAALIGAEPREIVFTSGATESNNLAIKGAARFAKERKDHVVTLTSEHKCVLECVRRLESEGFRTTILPVESDGLVDLGRLDAALDEKTVLVSIMAANNEIGVLQPVAEIGRLCRERGVLFHSDAAQAVGKVPLDVNAMTIDLLSISGHKFYGPMGIGALYVRGLGEACRIAREEMEGEARRLTEYRESFFQRVSGALEGVVLNGHRGSRLPGNLNLSFRGVDAERLIDALPQLAVSTGSACTSAEVEPSYVLSALGMEAARSRSALRIGFGRQTTPEEVSRAAELIVAAVRRLREEGPRAAE
jgi:cysteine desulfurase